MAVSHITSSQSHASGSFSVSQPSFSWTHTTSTDPQGVLVLVFQGVSATDAAVSVTYDGVDVPSVGGGRATDTATEPGSVEAFFLGSGVPTTNNPSVVVTRTNNTTTMWAVAVTVAAAADTEVVGIVLLQENGTFAVQSVNDGSTGVNSLRYAGAYYGGATPAPAGTGSTLLGTTNDAGAYGWSAVRETTAGQGARNVGFTQATSDDRAGVHLAIREVVPPPDPTGDVVYVDSTSTGNTALTNSRAPAVPAGVRQYDVVMVNLSRWSDPASNPAVTKPDGSWVDLGAITGADGRQRNDRYAKRLSGDDTGTYNFSWTGSMWTTAHATAYRGVDRDLDLTTLAGLSPPQAVTATNSGATFPVLTINSVPEGSAIHWHGTSETTSPGHTAPTGWAEVEDTDCDITAYQESVAAGNYSTNASAVGVTSDSNPSSMIALPPEPVAGGSTPVGKDLALVWNTRAALGDSMQAVWNTRAAVGKSLSTPWNVRTFVGKDVQALWNVRQAVGKSVQALWNTKAPAGKDLSLLWNTRSIVADSLQLVWNVRTFVGDELSLRWNTRAAVGDDLQLIWNTLAAITAVGKDLSLVWNTRQAVGDPLQIVWNTRAFVGKSVSLPWNVRVAVADTLQLVWNTRVSVGDPLDLRWNVRQAVGDEVQFLWTTKAPVGKSLQLLWDVQAIGIVAVGKDLSLRWNTKQAVGDTLDLRWNTRITVADALALAWNVRALAGDDLTLRWNTKAPVARDLQLLWDTRAIVSDTLDLRWGVRTVIGRSANFLWEVREAVGKSVVLVWDTEGMDYDPITDPESSVHPNNAAANILVNGSDGNVTTRLIVMVVINKAEANPQ